MIQERIHAGLARARKEGKRLGRPRVSPKVERASERPVPRAALSRASKGSEIFRPLFAVPTEFLALLREPLLFLELGLDGLVELGAMNAG